MMRTVTGCMILSVSLAGSSSIGGNAWGQLASAGSTDRAYGRLIPATTTMVTAWDTPRNPLRDSSLEGSARAEKIRKGFRLFLQTPRRAPRFTANKLSCNNCHLNAGQRERALPLVGVARVFPEYNKREGRLFTLEDRIVGCFMRSENATGVRTPGRRGHPPQAAAYPDTNSEEVQAIAAYITWLSEDLRLGEKLPWRGHNMISADSSLPIEKLDPGLGKQLYTANCQNCHGADGQGVQIGDKKAGPLWGPNSWNDGAGAARIYTLAGFIRYSMPYLNPGSLSDKEAQHIAAYINSKSRPRYPLKDRDYLLTGIPPDAVYYPARQDSPPQEHRDR